MPHPMFDETSTVMLDNLPDELLLKILRCYIPPMDLLRSVSLVSCRFATLIRHDSFWQQMHFSSIIPKKTISSSSSSEHHNHINVLTRHQLERICIFNYYASNNKDNNNNNSNSISSNNNSDHDKTDDSDDDDIAKRMPIFLEYGSILVPKECATTIKVNNIEISSNQYPIGACFASSTDNWHEKIENVLSLCHDDENETINWKIIRNNNNNNNNNSNIGPFHPPLPRPNYYLPTNDWGKYWSSTDSPTQNSNETLIFSTQYPLCLVSEIAIKPFTEIGPNRKYTWKKICIEVYNIKVGAEALGDPSPPKNSSGFPCVLCPDLLVQTNNNNNNKDRMVIDSTSSTTQFLANHQPVYKSIIYDAPPPNNDYWQYFELPDGVVIGNVIVITLIGKNFKQFNEYGYYVCVEKVAVRGIPLYTQPNQSNEYKTEMESYYYYEMKKNNNNNNNMMMTTSDSSSSSSMVPYLQPPEKKLQTPPPPLASQIHWEYLHRE